ncbi:MAG: Gfo/Idh/MocA family oxidoreductase [Planctomycetota bacterium]|nr:Gfo/Idh/MocA family oxidoreductase [Planctomycetota bacterium]
MDGHRSTLYSGDRFISQINRLEFLVAAAATGLAAAGLATARGAEGEKKIRMGLIGCGGYGMVDAKAALKAGGVEIVSLCDVDSEHLAASAEEIGKLQGKPPATYKLYDDLLKAGGIDAVIIGTPPHWHALQFIAALEKGCDVYCEKPLAYDVRECQAMVEAARRAPKQVVQIGFQRRHAGGFAAVRDYLQAGSAGRIVQVEAQIHYQTGILDTKPQDPPAALDWDLWCGPAPKIPYSPQVGHKNWRLEKTTGHGHLVDWGIHLIDATRWILGEGAPKAVTAAGGLYYFPGQITTPDVLTVHFEFEKCPVTWRHKIWGAAEFTPETSNGIFFYGEKETVFVGDDKWTVIPRDKAKERQVNTAKADAGAAHMAEFLDAVRTRKAPGCSPQEAFQSTTAVKLAMIAYDTGRKVRWDAAAGQIVGDAEAAALLKREYRAPWKHPWVG